MLDLIAFFSAVLLLRQVGFANCLSVLIVASMDERAILVAARRQNVESLRCYFGLHLAIVYRGFEPIDKSGQRLFRRMGWRVYAEPVVHFEICKANSLKVGTLGSRSVRFAVPAASARSWPPFICSDTTA